jgi:hypothetical protein
MDVPSGVRVRTGQTILSSHHNGMVSVAEALTFQRGTLKGWQLPEGFIPRVVVSQTISIDHPFKVTLSAGDNDQEMSATFTLGYVAGIVPQIDGTALDETDDHGNPPVLKVTEAAWKPRGNIERALIMLRYELDPAAFTVNKVVPVAVATVPAQAPWTWHKLIAIAIRDSTGQVTVSQQCFTSQEFDTSERKPSGLFRPWPRSAG